MVKLAKLERAKQLEERYNRREYKGKLSVLSPYIKYARFAESAKKMNASKHLLFASHLALLGITKGTSNAALFSSDLENLCLGIAHGLMPNADIGERELLKNLIQCGFITSVGALFLLIDRARPKEDEYPVQMGLYTELLIRLMIKTDAPSIYIESMVEALGITPKEKGIKALEAAILIFVLTALTKGETDEELFRAVRDRIQKNLASVDTWVEQPQLRVFAQMAQMALENQHYETFTKGVKDLLSSYSINLGNLKQDFETIRRLFVNIQSQFSVKTKGKDALITFTG